jgi:holo-[acyl-carrier protein] synthase
MSALVLRNGIDILELNRLESLDPAIKARFLKRVYTSRELALFSQSDKALISRFAAKEAVSKALGCGIGEVRWQDIEILRGKTGEPVLFLHGKAKELAEELGLINWAVSISHNRTQVAALVTAIGNPDKKT